MYSSIYQSAPDPRLFGPNGPYGMPAGGMGLPGMPFGGPQMGAPGVSTGGWAGALDTVQRGAGRVLGAVGDFTGFNDVSGLERGQFVTGALGGVADYFERKGDREEEKRRYEQALEESRRHRAAMGSNWNRAMGGI